MEENNQTENALKEQSQKPSTLWNWLLRLLQGTIIGVGAILPGISGGVLCVLFGIYRPMMALLAHPFRTFKKYAGLLLPVVIGVGIGFVGLAKVVEILFEANYNLAVWLFIGLIAGMIPSLFKEAGKKGRGKGSWISFSISTVVVFALLYFLQNSTKMQIAPNMGWYFVCGILWGVGFIVPGMSPSSLLIFLGLYEPMAGGIGNLDMSVLIPLILGMLLFVLISARGINYLFNKHYAIAFHIILGIVVASTLVIIPLQFKDIWETVFCMALFVVGFIVAYFMEKLGQKIKPKDEEEEEE